MPQRSIPLVPAFEEAMTSSSEKKDHIVLSLPPHSEWGKASTNKPNESLRASRRADSGRVRGQRQEKGKWSWSWHAHSEPRKEQTTQEDSCFSRGFFSGGAFQCCSCRRLRRASAQARIRLHSWMLVSREVLGPSSAEAQVSFCRRASCVQARTSAFGGTTGGGGPWAALSPAAAPSQCSGRGTGG